VFLILTALGYVDMYFSFIAKCLEYKNSLLPPFIAEIQKQEFKSKKDISGKGAQPSEEF
jgi:hypothetical protein